MRYGQDLTPVWDGFLKVMKRTEQPKVGWLAKLTGRLGDVRLFPVDARPRTMARYDGAHKVLQNGHRALAEISSVEVRGGVPYVPKLTRDPADMPVVDNNFRLIGGQAPEVPRQNTEQADETEPQPVKNDSFFEEQV